MPQRDRACTATQAAQEDSLSQLAFPSIACLLIDFRRGQLPASLSVQVSGVKAKRKSQQHRKKR